MLNILGEQGKTKVKSRGRLREKERNNTKNKTHISSECTFAAGTCKNHIGPFFFQRKSVSYVQSQLLQGAIAAGHEERKVQLGRQDHSQDLEADRVVMVGAD